MSVKPINSILFVCLGNICRSPLAEGVFRAVLAERGRDMVLDDIVLDSAATGGWNLGEAPDPRSIAIAARHGIDISGQRARKVRPGDFSRFDLILGMDRQNVRDPQGVGAGRCARTYSSLGRVCAGQNPRRAGSLL
ncbi:hypothetical protein X753_25730 [Mesorhizobium sp. LNJC399B00]|nr:hypothetical protein X753_25730 [Mesorhizobium sp. LNJC399B00]